METLPMPLDALAQAHGDLNQFLVSSPSEVVALLKQCADADVVVYLSSPGGTHYSTSLWAIDETRGHVSLTAEPNDVALQSLMEDGEVVAVCYLEAVKLQFDLRDLVLVRGVSSCALKVRMPERIYRFQRRSSFRVRPASTSSPVATLRHPGIPEMQLSLRVLDVSIGGIALFLPDDVPPIEPGSELSQVSLALDGDTRLFTGLVVHHVTLLNHESRGARLGCGMVNVEKGGERLLQRYIDHTQKRRRLLKL